MKPECARGSKVTVANQLVTEAIVGNLSDDLPPLAAMAAGENAASYRRRTFPIIVSRGQAVGALHSRTTENSIAAAKKANTRVRERIIIMYHDA
jgi:hypothetical protein